MTKEQYETEMNLWLKYFHALMKFRMLLRQAHDLKKQIEEREGGECITTRI
ncbi:MULTISPECIES: hypothetical protein [Candidatus Brocadia]|uniref:Uncharacterized protein n=1 Tax=Candidatus Brocadia sinica JPN1 TaxID=1197129 RepID=A0ABQ0JZC6_9BACT|nr:MULTISPECIES: hypothetical protein [Brocadia]NOG40075.1 hypothetical protein [Planctomycetota bacterium]GAN34102.1 hypothetical protein BROSI_A2638 [Candidatus Brocadia sinica JPN1]GIK14367.1 MAG: hypothetical protein BroJett002_30740 [Candidatus Brocadia sinica]GJQ17120.1 MAG: hypothetical protein HBSIN01_10790 [Candidatus Brocadia sinica]